MLTRVLAIDNSENTWKKFILNISFVILFFTLGIFIGLFVRNKQLIEKEIKHAKFLNMLKKMKCFRII